jgi:hypothetical protein
VKTIRRWRSVLKVTILIGEDCNTNTTHFYVTMAKRALEYDNVGEKRHKTVVKRFDWTGLPLEVIAHILGFDDDVHRPMAGLTCKAFRNASLVCSGRAGMKCYDAARNGWLSVLQWLREHGCPWDKWTCYWAAKGGHVEVLQWAREQSLPCPWDEWTCWGAARGGHLQVLQWAREHGCPWDKRTCSMAAGGGHLKVLQWAREQSPPCPWSLSTCRFVATEGGHPEVYEWLKDQARP